MGCWGIVNDMTRCGRIGILPIGILFLLGLLIAVVLGCGGWEESQDAITEGYDLAATAVPAPAAAARAARAPTAAPAATFAPAPTAAPAPASAEMADETRAAVTSTALKVQASPATQNRIIVHTGNMLLVVDDVAGSVDRITGMAREFGGWVVNSDRSSRHRGFVAIRVPAGSLTGVMDRLEGTAIDVKARSLTSEDVTDEYVDSQSRLVSLRETERVMLELLGRANDVEDALKVQQEITQLQVRIEELQGRINFLEETAAYSLLMVSLELSTHSMPVDVGPDDAIRVGEIVRFRATFRPPAGVENFTFQWDFGDGNGAAGSGGSAPKADDPGSRVTSSVNHVYGEEGDYVARITINGEGDAGLAEGTDALVASVTVVPFIEAFAGDNRVAEEGDEVEYRGSFTRPEGLWDFQFRWDFGDGTPTVTGNPDEGATRVEAVHSYTDHRPRPYAVTFTVSAMSDAGRVSASDSFGVEVKESRGFVVGGWDFGATGKAAVRALSAVGRALVIVLIWVGIFSPVWLIIGGILFFVAKRRRRRARLPEGGLSSPETGPSPQEAP